MLQQSHQTLAIRIRSPMASPATAELPPEAVYAAGGGAAPTRKEKRKAMKKLRRKQLRQESAIREREMEEAQANDPEEQMRIKLQEQEEAEAAERERRLFEEHERLWLEAAAAKKAEEEAAAARQLEEESKGNKIQVSDDADDEWEYVEEGPAEIIWKGNEIIVKKNRVRVRKMSADRNHDKEDDERPTSNPLPPQSAVFASYKNGQSVSAQDLIKNVAQQVPNFGTEQDKAHCPFHLKTGACRFGSRCSRAHFYPDKSCTLLIKNMYNGPGLAWEQDEGLEYTDEEIERCYEEFYEDVHTEFLKFGELVNFKVCKNGAYHLRGNVYVHYKSLESAILAYNTINGRFFAGKRISCEFIGVSRWKVAICGEYMKSRLRTCSHGTACNFIHCFRNPGGDYEWADWDDPPPRYWIKRMAVLFGPSVKAEYDEQMKLEERERPWDYNRKRTPTNYRQQSRRSIHCEMDTHDTGSRIEASDEKRNSRSPRREHYGRRKRTVLLHKHERCEEKHRSEIHGYNAKRTRDSHEDISKDQDRYSPEKHSEFEEKNALEDHVTLKKKLKTEEGLSRQQKREVFHNQEKPKEKYISKFYKQHDNECRSSDLISDNINDNEERSNTSSSEDSYGKHVICVKEKYDGRYGSADLGSDKYSHEKTLRQSKYHDERKEFHLSSQYHRNHVSHDKEQESKKERVRKQRSGDKKLFSDGSSDGMRTADRDIGREETHRHCLISQRNNQSFKEQNKSDRKRKHRRKKESSEIEEQKGNSDSDNVDSNGRTHKKHLRSRTSFRSSASSRGDRSHRRSNES